MKALLPDWWPEPMVSEVESAKAPGRRQQRQLEVLHEEENET
jgi:hypothetical protein